MFSCDFFYVSITVRVLCPIWVGFFCCFSYFLRFVLFLFLSERDFHISERGFYAIFFGTSMILSYFSSHLGWVAIVVLAFWNGVVFLFFGLFNVF